MAEETTPPAAPEKPAETDTKTLTQEQVDKVVEQRLARERQKFADYDALKEKASKFDDLEESNKSEIEKANAKASEAEQRATKAEAMALRIEVALDKAPEGMAISQVRKLAKRLQGDSRDDLEADAADLFSDFAPEDSPKDTGNGDTPGRPKERLTPGASPGTEPEQDPKEIADSILSESAF